MYQVYYVVLAHGVAAIRRRSCDQMKEGQSISNLFECVYKNEGHVVPLQEALNYVESLGEEVVSVINGPPLTYTMLLEGEMQLMVVTRKV